MARKLDRLAKAKTGIALCAIAAFGLALPGAGLALPSVATTASESSFGLFTPASVDPKLARRVSDNIRSKGMAARFTPAGTKTGGERTVTVAVRVDEGAARAIIVRPAAVAANAAPGRGAGLLSSTRYNLGIARGFQGFAKTPSLNDPLRKLDMPDLAEFEPARGSAIDKPSRFQPRISLEKDETIGRAPRTLDAQAEQSVDLGGAYRITRNLDVTAGVRLSQDRDRLAPLTDNTQDSQAVYVGTQFRF